jgi:GxxExxY protein
VISVPLAKRARDIVMNLELNLLSSKVIEAAIRVHSELGPGLLESVYSECMIVELRDMHIDVRAEISLPVFYRGKKVSEDGFRLDLLIEDKIIVELKSLEHIQPVHKKQVLTYLRLANKPLGLLINFNEALLKDGITRIINQKGKEEAA